MTTDLLNARQARFVLEWLVDRNGKQAAIRSGYAERSAESTGSRLLSNPKVAKAIAKGEERLRKRLDISAERVVLEYARLGFTNLTDVATWDGEAMTLHPSADLPEDHAAAVKEVKLITTITRGKDDYEQMRVERRIVMHDKKGALDSLAKHLGVFPEGEIVDGELTEPRHIRIELDTTDRLNAGGE